MSSTDRATCPNVSVSDVYTALKNYSSVAQNSTQIAYLNTQIQQSQKMLEQKTNDAAIAHARAAQVVRPEMNSSYYDSWFPLGRPLKRMVVPILVFLASLFISSSFFMLLGVIGIRSHFFVLVPDTEKMTGGLTKQFLMLFGITVILFGLTIYAFMR